MGKTILVTGKEGILGSGIAQHFLRQGYRVAGSVPTRKEVFPTLDQERRFLQFPWNRRSAVAAKNFVLQTVQEFEGLDEAWVLITPEREAFSLADLAPLVVDEGVDAVVKGTIYLIRELLQRQAVDPSLVLRFVFFDADPSTLPPLAALHYQGLKGMVTALLAQARRQQVSIWAYESKLAQADEYLTYLVKSKVPQPGQWNVFGEKKTLMGNLFPRKEPS